MTDPSKIDNMNGHQFEYYCADLLKRNGYRNVRVTPGSGDNGVDILADRDGVSYAIQCKCYSRKLGNKAVQEVFSGRTYYGCDEAVVLTNSSFTEAAKEAARRTGVILWDRDTLLAMDRVAYPSNVAYRERKGTASNTSNRSGCATVLILVLLVALLFSRCGSKARKEKENQSVDSGISAELKEPEEWVYPLLEEFDYSFQDKNLVLGEYKGDATSIIIPESYEVEGYTLPVIELKGTFRNNGNIVNLVIPEGVEQVQSGTFRKSNSLKHIYIPSSMKGSESILENFTDGEILFYGGTEEQFQTLCHYTHWSDLKFKRILFNTSPNECIDNIDLVVVEEPGLTQEEYVPLSDFEYDLFRNELTILRYVGKEKIVRIAPTYIVNGEECSVVGFGAAVFRYSVDTVIIPEGVRKFDAATFNSSHVRILYIPASLIEIPKGFWDYFHDLETVYYGGTEEQFHKISPVDRWNIDVKHMIYNASPTDVPVE